MLHKERIEKLRTILSHEGCDAFVVEDKTNLFYLTGQELSAGRLIVDTKDANLFVDNRYYELCQRNCPINVSLITTSLLSELLNKQNLKWIRSLGFDTTRTTYKQFQELESTCKEYNIKSIPLEDPISHLRLIKDSEEVKLLTEAANLGSEGFDYVLTLLKEGITEEEIARELEIFWKRKGSKSLGFDPIIAFAANSSMPHYRAGNAQLKAGDIVLIDIGVNYRHYHSDMTRTVFFKKTDVRLLEIYQIVHDAQAAALALCKPGTLVGDLDKAARDHIIAKGFGDFFTHNLGHGVGLDIHEAPWLRNKEPHNQVALEAGMVITIEPGIYLPGIGGVRIEDSVVITADGYENLTNRSKNITII